MGVGCPWLDVHRSDDPSGAKVIKHDEDGEDSLTRTESESELTAGD